MRSFQHGRAVARVEGGPHGFGQDHDRGVRGGLRRPLRGIQQVRQPGRDRALVGDDLAAQMLEGDA